MKTAQCSRPDRRQLSASLADRRARQLLGCLQDGPATVRDLSVALAATDLDCARSAVTTVDRHRHRQRLEHHYLPGLQSVGLLTQSPDGLIRSVPATLDQFEVQFPPLAEPDHPDWPAAAAVVGRAYRYPLVSVLAERETITLSALADRLAEAGDDWAVSAHDLAIALHHVDLPKLAAVDLLAYDAESRTATSTPTTDAVL